MLRTIYGKKENSTNCKFELRWVWYKSINVNFSCKSVEAGLHGSSETNTDILKWKKEIFFVDQQLINLLDLAKIRGRDKLVFYTNSHE